MKIKRKLHKITALIGFLLIVIGSIAFYNLIQQGTLDILGWAGITNIYVQNGLIVLVALGILILLSGFGFFRALWKLAKG